jgi:hypothetical protein
MKETLPDRRRENLLEAVERRPDLFPINYQLLKRTEHLPLGLYVTSRAYRTRGYTCTTFYKPITQLISRGLLEDDAQPTPMEP